MIITKLLIPIFTRKPVMNTVPLAAFLVRTLGLEGGGPGFDDTQGNMFEPEIAILAAEDITKGCNPPDNDLFCPDRAVTRAEVATFLARALDLDVIDNPANGLWQHAQGGQRPTDLFRPRHP